MTGNSSRMEEQSTVNRMHIVDLKSLLGEANSLEGILHQTEGVWVNIFEEMDEEETLWVFSPNEYRNGECWPVAMAVADYARENTDLVLKNIITRFQDPEDGGDLENVYEEILFFVKNKRKYRFHKDAIRVEHVYKGKEWGEDRETGRSSYHDTEVQRYNPNGKDPGNIWLREIRDKSPDETIDETQPLPRPEALKRCIRAGSDDGEPVHLWFTSDTFYDTVREEGREVRIRSMNLGDVV